MERRTVILNLVDQNDPILREIMPEYDFESQSDLMTTELSQNLCESLIHHGGSGIAAPQLGLRQRVFVMLSNPIRICFNPRIVDQGEEMVEMEEGCLSIKNISLKIKRPRRIRVRYTLPNQETLTEVFHDITARIFQHELDHLNGILFIDHVSKLKLDIAKRKGKKI